MKCPVCQAKLLPVDGEMFCLQCGQTLRAGVAATDTDNLKLEETSDPMLQRAIRDAGNYETQFAAAPAPAVEAVKAAAKEDKPAADEKKPTEQAKKPAAHAHVKTVKAAPAERKRSFVSLHAVVMAPRALSPAGMLVNASAMPAESQTGAPAERREFVRVREGRTHSGVRRWLAGAAVVAVFAGLNYGMSNYYADRVYPGVKVGDVNVGGWTSAELSSRLPEVLQQPALSASIEGRTYPLDVSKAATVSQEAVSRAALGLGKQSPLPLAGALQAWLAGPVKPAYSLTDDALEQAVSKLAIKVERSATDAVITTMGSNVVILSDKPGLKLDREAAAAAIRATYGTGSAVTLSLAKVAPKVTAADLATDKDAAEAVIAQNLQLVVRKAKYTPTAEQLAGWVKFKGPGLGVTIDPNGPATFVAAIPGAFDRAAATASLTEAAAAHQAAVLTASTKRTTLAPKAAPAAAAAPIVTYKYCVQSTLTDVTSLKTAAKAALGAGGGWTFGGRIAFEAADSGCNFDLQIADVTILSKLDPACPNQSTCRIHNDLAINAASWSTPPTWWKSDLAAYRQELINHLVGQWLGFEHDGCQAPAPATPVSQATITVAGCSPHWHPVPVEIQDTKILPGF